MGKLRFYITHKNLDLAKLLESLGYTDNKSQVTE